MSHIQPLRDNGPQNHDDPHAPRERAPRRNRPNVASVQALNEDSKARAAAAPRSK